MSDHAILLLAAIAATAFVAAMELRALVILARSGRQKKTPEARERRRNLWGQVAFYPIVALGIMAPALISDWKWRIACILAGITLLALYLLVLLWVRYKDRRSRRSG